MDISFTNCIVSQCDELSFLPHYFYLEQSCVEDTFVVVNYNSKLSRYLGQELLWLGQELLWLVSKSMVSPYRLVIMMLGILMWWHHGCVYRTRPTSGSVYTYTSVGGIETVHSCTVKTNTSLSES